MKSQRATAKRARRIRVEALPAADVARLESFRISRRWSYRELAEDMSIFLGVRMPEPTVIQALKVGSGLPTTIQPIRKYIGDLVVAEAQKASA